MNLHTPSTDKLAAVAFPPEADEVEPTNQLEEYAFMIRRYIDLGKLHTGHRTHGAYVININAQIYLETMHESTCDAESAHGDFCNVRRHLYCCIQPHLPGVYFCGGFSLDVCVWRGSELLVLQLDKYQRHCRRAHAVQPPPTPALS
ncbi:hypothetical protein AaE_007722, partial [Aphanomyces astaci]